jgi:hypothetical protein
MGTYRVTDQSDAPGALVLRGTVVADDVPDTAGLREQARAEWAEQKADTIGAAGLLWEQAKAQLAAQKADVDALRTRAVALLSVASLVAGLFGSRLPHDHTAPRTVIASITALALFGISVVLVLLIAAPKQNWLFTFELCKLLKEVDEGKASPGNVTRNLAVWGELYWSKNQGKLDAMYSLFGRTCALVGLQVVAWAIAAL